MPRSYIMLVILVGLLAGCTGQASASDPQNTAEAPSTDFDVSTPVPNDNGDERCDWEFVGNELTGNRVNQLPPSTLQVVLFYDGERSNDTVVSIPLSGGSAINIGAGAAGGPINSFHTEIETREYRLYDCEPAGVLDIDGLVPNGVIDGLAWGIMWKDADGNYSLARSTPAEPTGQANFVGLWPLGMNDTVFAERLVEMDGFGREIARTIIWGASLQPEGEHVIDW